MCCNCYVANELLHKLVHKTTHWSYSYNTLFIFKHFVNSSQTFMNCSRRFLNLVETSLQSTVHTYRVGRYYDSIIYRDIKSHHNPHQREIFSIVISSTCYCYKFCDYHKIHCSETCTSIKCSHLIFTILVAVVLLSDIVITSLLR